MKVGGAVVARELNVEQPEVVVRLLSLVVLHGAMKMCFVITLQRTPSDRSSVRS